MPYLVDRMPFMAEPGEFLIGGERVLVRAEQIIVWVSLSLHRRAEPNPSAVPFPVIVDTGHTHSFSIQERHLVEWAGLRPEALGIVGAVRDRGNRVLLRTANIWVHPNKKGRRDLLAGGPLKRLKAKQGIAVYPDGDFPRLPILGLRVISENGLILTVDGRRREATLRTSEKWWPFG